LVPWAFDNANNWLGFVLDIHLAQNGKVCYYFVEQAD
jgi:hypothetical protein